MKKIILLILMLLLYSSLFAGNKTTATPVMNITNDNIGSLLCGIPCTLPDYIKLEKTPAAKELQTYFKTSWEKMDRIRFQPMQKWAATEIADSIPGTKVLFNAFGGPDFLTAFVFYPDAETHILFGLEPVGNLPQLDKMKSRQLQAYLKDIQTSFSDFFRKSYFMTKNMKIILEKDKADGVLPLLLVFLKKAECSIGDIKRLEFDAKGELVEIPYQQILKRIKMPYGIKIIYFTKNNPEPKTMYYYCCDVQDKYFYPGTPLYNQLSKMNNITSFIKCASYLLHYGTFSNMRNLILDKSQYILEDDTGIPYRFFKEKEWEVQLYGVYAKPVQDFIGVEQPVLQKLFQDKTKVKKLPFHLGYHWEHSYDSWLYVKKINTISKGEAKKKDELR